MHSTSRGQYKRSLSILDYYQSKSDSGSHFSSFLFTSSIHFRVPKEENLDAYDASYIDPGDNGCPPSPLRKRRGAPERTGRGKSTISARLPYLQHVRQLGPRRPQNLCRTGTASYEDRPALWLGPFSSNSRRRRAVAIITTWSPSISTRTKPAQVLLFCPERHSHCGARGYSAGWQTYTIILL